MTPIEIAAAAVALALAVSAGLVAHELAHAAVLRAAGVAYRIDWFPGDDTGVLGAGLRGRWAAVRPRATGETPAWVLRCSAMMPLALAVPLALVPLGVVADPFATDGLVRFAAVGWMACALPSPQDFSVLWYADTAVAAAADDASSYDASTDEPSAT
ncbi:hypothetical protein [Halosimplex pelagicum]|uniref:DUF3267 domain-containing protein n=1 Tax=Halosimplex pelagicum TaxID=869886 RepID=A0A7D5T6C2_9EURY|nr:hypothetical protein [Halosimplex pelagicum]QLH84071.1 hypothetical protein HZS54_21600 [Halosimplex pelagicum]